MSLAFSNQVISITGTQIAEFAKALSFFFPDQNSRVEWYAIDPKKGLILYWCFPDSNPKTSGGATVQRLPYDMRYEAAWRFAWNWLGSEAASKLLGDEPDHDGDNERGWLVYNEEWTHVDSRWEGLVAIKPIWAMYGK